MTHPYAALIVAHYTSSLLKNPAGLLLLALAPEAAPLKMSKSKSKSKR